MSDETQVTTTPAPTPAKASKPKKGGKKPPAAPKPERKKRGPVRTLASWLREQGPDHVEAARILGPDFKGELRRALHSKEEHDKAMDAQVRAVEAVRVADERVKATSRACSEGAETILRLVSLVDALKAHRPQPKPAEPPATPLFDGTSPQ